MSAGVEILLLVVPVWVWIIDWSYCRVIPKDEHDDPTQKVPLRVPFGNTRYAGQPVHSYCVVARQLVYLTDLGSVCSFCCPPSKSSSPSGPRSNKSSSAFHPFIVSKDDASSSIITSSSFKLSSVVLSVCFPCLAQFSAIVYPYTLISLSLSSASPSISALSYAFSIQNLAPLLKFIRAFSF